MKSFVLLFLCCGLIVNFYTIFAEAEPQCFSEDRERLISHFGTKTAYRFVQNNNDTEVKYEGK